MIRNTWKSWLPFGRQARTVTPISLKKSISYSKYSPTLLKNTEQLLDNIPYDALIKHSEKNAMIHDDISIVSSTMLSWRGEHFDFYSNFLQGNLNWISFDWINSVKRFRRRQLRSGLFDPWSALHVRIEIVFNSI